MASRRILVSSTTGDALAVEEIRRVEEPSIINFWAGSVTVTDELALFMGKTEIMPAGTANVHAAALGLIDSGADQLVFNSAVGVGDLRVPVGTLTTSLIFLLSVEPAFPFG